MILTIRFVPLALILLCSFTLSANADSVLKHIKLPPGFSISYFSKDVKNARTLVLGERGTVFVSTRQRGHVYAVIDRNQDGQADQVISLAKGLNMPNGIAFHQGDLYVAEVHRVLRFKNIEQNLRPNAPYEVVVSNLPTESHHGWRYIAFGPDKQLYIAIGAPCNICNETGYATINRLDLKTGKRTIVAQGVRNSVGFTWSPHTGKMWFTDNGRDLLGDDVPPDEINRLDKEGEHFGYPYCHAGTIKDPEYGRYKDCKQFKPPQVKLQAHVAPLGIRFYTGSQFPVQYRNQIFVAEHGSWNRSSKVGYQITMVKLKNDNAVSHHPFATGWLQGESTRGRPVDLLVLKDGSLLVSDDYRGVIYRITYQAR